MYKKQIKCQKLLCIVAIISCAIAFLYALGLMTDLYDALYSTMRNPYDLTETDVSGSSPSIISTKTADALRTEFVTRLSF